MNKFSSASVLLLTVWSGILCCCSRGPTPNSVVLDFLGKDMNDSDTTAMLAKLDVQALVQERKEELSENGDTLRASRYTADSLMADLTAGGEINTRWLSLQIIVSNFIERGDSAEVEVSFIDATRDTQYYNRMGLYKKDKSWKIYSFKTLK
jgi:hypothetical protein